MPVILLAHVDDDHQPAATLLLDIVVRRMVRDVAMDQPFAGALGLPDDIVALSGADIDRVGHESRRLRDRLTIAGDDLERAAMDVHRVDEADVRADEAQLERFPRLVSTGTRFGPE